MRLVALVLSLLTLAACGKSRECRRFADRNLEHADAIEAVIMDDYERFAALARERMGTSPPTRVREAAQRSATQWRETLTDPLLAQTCTADWTSQELAPLLPCLEREPAHAYAECVLEAMQVPRLAPIREGE